MSKSKVTLTIQIDPDLDAWLCQQAAARGSSKVAVLRALVVEAMAADRQFTINQGVSHGIS